MGYVGKVKDTAGSTHLVGSTLYGTCSTAAATAAKVVTCSDFSELVTGVTIHVKFTYSNTASSATLNVNSTGAKNLCSYGTTRVGTTEKTSWKAGAVVSLTYDGTSWVMNDYIPDTGDTNTDTKVTQTVTTSAGQYPILLKNTTGTSTVTDTARFAATAGKVPTINPSTGDLSVPSMNEISIKRINTGGSSDGIEIIDTDQQLATQLIIPEGYQWVLGYAAELGYITDFSGSTIDDSKVPTAKAVADYVAAQAAGAATFQGTLVQTEPSPASATKWTQAELEAASYKKGWYWVAEAAGTYAGNVMEVGDMLFCVSDKGSAYAASDFTAIQNNIETLTTTEIDTLWAAA